MEGKNILRWLWKSWFWIRWMWTSRLWGPQKTRCFFLYWLTIDLKPIFKQHVGFKLSVFQAVFWNFGLWDYPYFFGTFWSIPNEDHIADGPRIIARLEQYEKKNEIPAYKKMAKIMKDTMKQDGFERVQIKQPSIFRGHVSFREGKSTPWNKHMKITPWKRRFLLETIICRGYVRLC